MKRHNIKAAPQAFDAGNPPIPVDEGLEDEPVHVGEEGNKSVYEGDDNDPVHVGEDDNEPVYVGEDDNEPVYVGEDDNEPVYVGDEDDDDVPANVGDNDEIVPPRIGGDGVQDETLDLGGVANDASSTEVDADHDAKSSGDKSGVMNVVIARIVVRDVVVKRAKSRSSLTIMGRIAVDESWFEKVFEAGYLFGHPLSTDATVVFTRAKDSECVPHAYADCLCGDGATGWHFTVYLSWRLFDRLLAFAKLAAECDAQNRHNVVVSQPIELGLEYIAPFEIEDGRGHGFVGSVGFLNFAFKFVCE